MSSTMTLRAAAVRLAGAALLISALACVGASAQRFEYTYGGACDEEGHGGVQQVTEGGYVAAGFTKSVNAGCINTDIYVVRTNSTGSLAWARTYRIGSNNVAYDIQEVKNAAGGTDGFILVGKTMDPAGCGGVGQDLLFLRLDRCGNVMWVRSIDDGHFGYEAGYDVVVATNGDFIAAGTCSGGVDGLLVRISPAGVLLWAKKYDFPAHGTDYLYALDEASNGDIIAAGGTNSTVSGTYDTWVMRVSSTGTFIAAPHNSVQYGSTAFDEDLRSIQKITQGTKAGDFIAVGRSEYGHLGHPDALLVETSPDPCTTQASRLYGDFGNNPDEAYCVREIKPFTGTGTSNIIVTGYLTPPAAVGFGLQDAFLKEFTTGTLAPLAGNTGAIYGSAQVDWGWSVSQTSVLTPCTTDGFIVAGWGHGTMADPKQLYEIKTDALLSSNCSVYYSAPSTVPSFSPRCLRPDITVIGASCTPTVTTTSPTWATQICFIADGTSSCSIPTCVPTKPAIGQDLGDNVVDVNEATIMPYPSPVHAGSNITVEYVTPGDGPVEIMVSAMNGTVVHQRSEQQPTGINRTTIATDGWPSGAYMIRVTVNNHAYSRSVVVLDR